MNSALESLNGLQDVNSHSKNLLESIRNPNSTRPKILTEKFPVQSNYTVLKWKEVELNKTREETLRLKNISETEVDVTIIIEDFDYEVILS